MVSVASVNVVLQVADWGRDKIVRRRLSTLWLDRGGVMDAWNGTITIGSLDCTMPNVRWCSHLCGYIVHLL